MQTGDDVKYSRTCLSLTLAHNLSELNVFFLEKKIFFFKYKPLLVTKVAKA